MPPTIVVIIREDPLKSPRPVEGLRIALGLSTGTNPLTVILLGDAARLLTTDEEDIQDGETLEQYLPSLKQLEIPILVSEGSSSRIPLDPAITLREASLTELASRTASADCVLAF